MRPSQLFLFIVLVTVSLKSTQAFPPESDVIDNTTGTLDTRFTKEVGTEALQSTTEFFLNSLGQTKIGEIGYDVVLPVVESFVASGKPFVLVTTDGSLSLVDADYQFDEFTGIVFATSDEVWQWTGNGTAPTGLITGMNDYMSQTAGWGYEGRPPRGSGLRWDEGYAITANFLEFCDLLRPGFVSDLNAMMMYSYSDAYFVELLGKPVDELWEDYKLFYGSPGPASSPPLQTFTFRVHINTEEDYT